MQTARVAGLVVAALLCAVGCAGAPTPRDEASVSRGFAELQQHEARLEEARLGVARNDAPCPTRCQAQLALFGARDRICALADELGDPDARRRCEHARHTGEGGVEVLQQSCGCAPSGS